jgi:hypothetical protein
MRAYADPELQFGATTLREVAAVERVRKAALALERAVKALEGPTLERLNRESRLTSEVRLPVASECCYLSEKLKDGAESLRDSLMKHPKASQNRNWVAAAVAATCREIWAEEERRARPEMYGRLPILNALAVDGWTEENRERAARFRHHLDNFAPQSAKQASPGPFGRFLENVLRALFVLSEGGEVVSAQVALRSMKEARKQMSDLLPSSVYPSTTGWSKYHSP